MKILITGVNNSQARENYYLNKRSKYRLVTAATGLVNALKDMGHDVEQRFVTPGEDLSMFDKIIAFYCDVTGGMQPGAWGFMWALSQRKDVIIAIDDWQTPNKLYKNCQRYKTIEDAEKQMFRDFIIDSQPVNQRNLINDDNIRAGIINGFIENIFETRTFLYCAFNKFDISKFFNIEHKYSFFNPEAYVPSPMDRLIEFGLVKQKNSGLNFLFDEEPEEIIRERKWIIAGIGGLPTKKACKFKDIFTWPVEIYGKETIDVEAKLVTEPEVIDTYRRAYIVFYPDQGNFGSNWWRNRPRQCADMGAVLYIPNNEEAALFGESYMNLSIEKLESMSNAELDILAKKQRNDFYKSNPLCKETVKKQLGDILCQQ